MLRFDFEPFETVIRNGKPDFSAVVGDAEAYVVIQSAGAILHVTDPENFKSVEQQLEELGKTPQGRSKLRSFFSHVQIVAAADLGKTILDKLSAEGEALPVRIEPGAHSLRVTALRRETDAEV